MAEVIVFDGLWKKFRKGERHDSLRDVVPSLLRRAVRRSSRSDLGEREFWALQDLSFAIGRGEAVGIIGPNGAGKSTALKLLTRILKPERGYCQVSGRLGALIEVAAGFHPDLTGRENVFLQGAIMGMRRAEIDAAFDEIVAFAGIEAFIDTPTKRYSSGMQARLGFSVAAHMRPDVMLIDEVLSVGDVSFQHRCMEKMKEKVRDGVAVVFVSHNLQAVAALCPRTVVLSGGQKLFDGATEGALEAYLNAAQKGGGRWGAETGHLQAVDVKLTSEGLEVLDPLKPGANCTLLVTFRCLKPVPAVGFGVDVERTRDLFYCWGGSTEELGVPRQAFDEGAVFTLRYDFTAHFARGHYRINVNVRDSVAGKFLFFTESIAGFTIAEDQSYDGVTYIAPAARIDVAPVAKVQGREAVTA